MGHLVGSSDGTAFVGRADGAALGAFVGAADGVLEGTTVGFCEGSWVGVVG